MRHFRSYALAAVCFLGYSAQAAFAQQVVQRGAGGRPDQVMDETAQWTTPVLMAQDHDVALYIPDVTSPDWLKRNYPDWRDGGFYTLSMFTFYKTPQACVANQTGWGLADKSHLDACVADIGYRVRQAKIEPDQKAAVLLMAGMIDQHGQLDADLSRNS